MLAQGEVFIFGGLEELISFFTIPRRVTEYPLCARSISGTEESEMN